MAKGGDVSTEADSPPAMSSFLATRAEARGRSCKAAAALQEQISQTSKGIQARWAELEKEWRNLEKERRDSASTHGITGGGGPIVELNVGGTDMDVLRSDLVRAEESVLADMFSGRWEGRFPRDSRGRIFLDVSPACFRKVVGFLVKLGIAQPGKVLELPTLTPDEQPCFDHLVSILGLWPHVYEGKAAAAPPPPPRQRSEDNSSPPVEPAEARRFGRSVAASFAAEELALDTANAEFRAARKRFDREVESVSAFAGAPTGHGRDTGSDDDIVELNIGGTVAATRRSTLCRCGESVLARMFDPRNEKRAPPFVKDTKGRYFVQYNDYCFAKIVEVLRLKRWHVAQSDSDPGAAGGMDARFRIYVREDEREDFSSLVSYFFPGCEKFVTNCVGKVGALPKPPVPVTPKVVPKPKPKAPPAAPESPARAPKRGEAYSVMSILDIRVGKVDSISVLTKKSQAVIKVQVDADMNEPPRAVLWHFETPPPPVGSPVIVLCNLPYIKFEGILFTAVVLCMDDDLLLPPPDAQVGELITVKGHPSKPCKNTKIVTAAWEKVLNDELFHVGDDEVVRFEHGKYPGPLMTSKGPVTCS